jgi:hypothetical protein
MDEADALFSRGDHASAADVLMKATLYNKMLTDIEGDVSSSYRMARLKSKVRSKKSILGKRRKTITTEQMDILLRIGEQYNTSYDFEASQWFWSKLHQNELPSTIEEFENKYPQGSREFQLFERFTSKFELAGLLIEYGRLDEDFYYDRYGGLQAEWERAKPIIYGIRKQWNEPRFRENFAILLREEENGQTDIHLK